MADIELVNDAFWLQYAAEHTKNAVTSRDDAASKMDTYLAAIWTIYTGVLAAAIVFRQLTDDLVQIVFMALPVLILPIARFYCLNVLLPPSVEYHPESPESIRTTLYEQVLATKNRRLTTAKVWTFISAISISLSLFSYKVADGAHPKKYFVEAKYNNATKSFLVTGLGEPEKPFSVSLAGISDTTRKTWTYYEGSTQTTNADGSIFFVVPADTIQRNLKLILSWTDATGHLQTIRN